MKTFTAALITAAMAAPIGDLMGNLPDAPAFTTKTYSGYLTVNDTKSLHYIFAESESDPANDPVTIWFNGGPGCSSILAFMQENGPLCIDDGEDFIKTNPYPWTTRMNMLWIESPAGVGYSIAGTVEDLSTNDMIQSQDALAALKQWFGKFPEYLPNPLFVSGESYGGIYVPYLTWQIYQNNKQAAFSSEALLMNLQGMMVGNGATKWAYDVEPSFPATARWFNVIPPALYDEFEANNCAFYFFEQYDPTPATPLCVALWDKINELTAELNWYDLYRPTYDNTLLSAQDELHDNRMGYSMVAGEIKSYRRGYTMQEYTPWARHMKRKGGDVILGDYMTDYMNREDVRAAFHIPTTVQGWEMCSSTLDYHEQDEASFWIYGVLKNKYRMMFYSGDTDGAVTTYGSKRWIKDLAWGVKDQWRPWFTDGQVSGYVETYNGGLDFVTVKGVGHMAPQWARKPVTNMITAWAFGESF